MISSPPLTWSSLIAHYSAPAWQPFAELARRFYAQQGRLLPAAQYLALAPAAAAEPFRGNVAAQQLLAAALPAAGPPDETSAQYVARGRADAQPVLAALVEALTARGVTAADFAATLALPDAGPQPAALLTADFWAALTGAWQQQVQLRLDREGRGERLLAAQPDIAHRDALAAAAQQLAANRPADSLPTLSLLPLNELARDLWVPAPPADNPLLAFVLGSLRAAARQVMAQNYPDAELTTRLVATLAPELQASVQALFAPAAEGQPPLTTVAELAGAEAGTLAERLVALPANHPFVYALAALFQDATQRFLQAEAPALITAAPALPPVVVRGQLLGAYGTPLAGFTLRLTQVPANPPGTEQQLSQQLLGELRTDSDGRFSLLVPRARYLNEADAVAEAAFTLQVAVYPPGQDLAGEPALMVGLLPPADGAELPVATDLTATPDDAASAEVAQLSGELPGALSQLLADNHLTTLRAVREAGGLGALAPELLADPATAGAVQRLDALAQFEVVSPDTPFLEQVVASGFSSPAQLLDTTSQAEFVERVSADLGDEAGRAQAAAFYEQTAAVQALSQTLGLLAAADLATAGPAGGNDLALSAAAATSLDEGSARLASQEAQGAEPAPGGDGMAFATTDGAAEAQLVTELPGHTIAPAFNPALAGPVLAYAAGEQCDCPACRSAVGPTAYLAALLKYATGNLRQETATGPASVAVKDLQTKFYQPFCDLSVSCQSADEPVCRYRLAIEVMQAHWRSLPAAEQGAALTVAQARPYVEAVLEALLQALGTSLAEVRAATELTRPALAARLSLPVETLFAVQDRFSPAALAGTRPLDAVEANLEELFGLASTARDPLSTGLLLATSNEGGTVKLTRWNLQGLDWARNTGLDGLLSLEVTPATSAATTPEVTAYVGERSEDSVVARGNLLPSTSTATAPGTFTALLHPQHGSGLKGSVVVQLTGAVAATTFTLAVLPAVTAGRRQALEAGWLAQDAAASQPLRAHTQPSWNGFTFLVDPDLLGPDDFRPLRRGQADLGNRAYQLWRRRYAFLQTGLVPGLLSAANPAEGDVYPPHVYNSYAYGAGDYRGINSELLDPASPAPDPAGATAPPPAAAAPALTQLLDALTRHSLTYTGDPGFSATRVPWRRTFIEQRYGPGLTGTQLLARLHADAAGDAAASGFAAEAMASLGLSLEALQRLHELWQLSRVLPPAAADYEEALDLIRQTVKKRFESAWTVEEQLPPGNPVTLGARLFQPALNEPQAGRWERARAAEFSLSAATLPRIDPDEITPLDLPDAGLGDQASALWRARQAELLAKRQAILARGPLAPAAAGAVPTADEQLAAMLAYAYQPNRFDPASAALPVPAPFGALEDVWEAYLSENDPQQHAAAVGYVEQTLMLRPAEAERLLALRAQVLTQASDSLWLELAALLTLGWKRAVAYRQSYVAESVVAPSDPAAPFTPPSTSSWLAQEAATALGTGTALDQLIHTRKHRLVQWRAPSAGRAAWGQALALTVQRPLLDPDQFVPGDFRQAGERSRNVYQPAVADASKPYLNPAFNLYMRRAGLVQFWYDTLQAEWGRALNLSSTARPNDARSGRYAFAANLLNSTPAEVQQLHAQLHANVDVSAALRRLHLTGPGLDLLVAQLDNPSAERTPEMLHLLVQQRRLRQYGDWTREEMDQGFTPSPLYFREPQAETVSLAAQPWRSSARERRQWQRNLKARFDQARAVTAAQQQAVRSAEDQYLPLLRDALLAAKVGAPTDSSESKLEWLGNRYLLDFKIACCQHTTRVAQGMEVLQRIFLDLRGGIPTNGLTLTTVGTTFEQDWQWLSSYERWRSLMFLYLYPQNVLLPALKPGQSSQFQQTVRDLRQAARITPAGARDYMDAYQEFLTDMGTLKVGAAVQTTLDSVSADGFQAAGIRQPVSIQVALAASQTAYANLHALDTSGAAENNFRWVRLPGAILVGRLVGATVYQPADGERYVYVFALVLDEQKNTVTGSWYRRMSLAYQRMSLRTLIWDDDYTRLGPADTDTLDGDNVQLAHTAAETWAPVIVGLRKKYMPLYTDFPYSQPVYGAGTSAGPDTRLGLDNVLGSASSYHVDLFFVGLDAQGTGVAFEQTRTFCLVGSVALLACVRQSNESVFCAAAIQTSYDANWHLHTTWLSLTNTSSSDQYIVNQALRAPAATLVTGTGSTAQTTYFKAGPRQQLFSAVVANIRRAIDYGYGDKFPMSFTYGIHTSDSPNNALLLPLMPQGYNDLVVPAVGVRLTAGTQSMYLSNVKLTIYYNRRRQQANSSSYSPKTYKLDLDIATFSNEWIYAGDRNQPLASTNTISAVTSTEYASTSEYYFVGPALRTAGGLSSTDSIAAPNEVIGCYGDISRTYEEPVPGAVTLALGGGATRLLGGPLPSLPPLFSPLTTSALSERRAKLTAANVVTPLGASSFVNTLVSEAYYSLPILLAQELVRGRNYDLALHYFRLVYDYTRLAPSLAPDPQRLVYPALINNSPNTFDSVFAWLNNPNNPYTLAGLRADSHLQFVVMSVVRCLLAYADSEFTRDTAESVARARGYYELAARLLRQEIIQNTVSDCASLLDPVDATIPAAWLPEWRALKTVLAGVNQRAVLEQVLRQATVGGVANRGLLGLFAEAKAGNRRWADAFTQAWELVNGQLDALQGGYVTLCGLEPSPSTTSPTPVPALPAGRLRPYVPFLSANFCVPTNPVPLALLLQAELNLYKIRTCRNIAGIQRELDPYAAPTDTTTGLPAIEANGRLVRTGRLVVPATQYRYAYIIERARQLVSLAQQAEASLLSALEKRDSEAYNLLKARQDISVSKATIQLQTLRTREAEDGIDLAELQLERSEIMENQYEELLGEGLIGWEIAQLVAIGVEGVARVLAASARAADIGKAVLSLGTASAASAFDAVAAAAATTAQISGLQASYKRREQEWQFQRNLAGQDIKIGQQQIRLSEDRLRIVGQEKRISELQLDHAESVLNFLTTKFTNAELYDWMSQILEGAYSYFLQQATATARTAELQLAFERQEAPAEMVQEDYWSPPADGSAATEVTPTAATDRKGLTGSVRLLQDLTRLDQYAFETNRRKLQLTKTISLAQYFPTEFVRFRETGVLAFACQPEWFDQDFPGQYLRIIRRVRTSIIALVPPTDGIKAKLGTAGNSRVVVGGAPFQTLTLPRPSESVSLTSPINATGLFELEQQATELLYPFEGLGVDVPWTFAMPPASNANLDYSAIADVLVSLDYTALESADYARQVVQELGTERQQLVALSLRNRFADQWYDLHHAAELAPADQYVVRLPVTAADLPRNLRNARVSQLSLYVDAPLDVDQQEGSFTDRSHLEVRLTRGAGTGGAAFTNQYGLISTRTGTGAGPLYTGNAAGFVPLLGAAPAGEWVLTVAPGRLRERLAAGLVNDIYLILEVEGDAPAYIL
ncbi:neuraminidase-like domain-containing protein [uncultured Hymenobacter sp.]|uniref:Tc toxin subunit A-related protein n=1 Tax=uncultured Hymenobacter sp. TaxID=170016 RepID=UPI0035CAD523